jgi:hypothetical protein
LALAVAAAGQAGKPQTQGMIVMGIIQSQGIIQLALSQEDVQKAGTVATA